MKEKKRLLFIVTKGNFGGAQRYVFDLAVGLKKEYDVSVATGEPGLLHTKLHKENIKTITTPSLQRDINVAHNLSSVWELVQTLKETAPDIVHANSSMAGFITSLAVHTYNIFYAPKDKKTKFIFTAHGWAFNEKSRSASSKFLFYILHTVTVILSHKTISVSNQTKKELAMMPFVDKKITVIHNGIKSKRLISQKNARLKLSPASEFKTWLGTLSELHKNKGLDTALKGLAPVLKENPDIGFFIAGDGEEKESLINLSKKLGISNQVIFLGFVQDAQKYLKAFDIFTLTSRTECFPYVLMEAGLAKNPVIATDVGGISEIIENLYSGMLIRPNSPIDVSHAVAYALEHTKELKEFGINLHESVKTNLSIEKMIKETQEVYGI
jgi:L-malate glycosyltransferase